jgi:hypothetical protein
MMKKERKKGTKKEWKIFSRVYRVCCAGMHNKKFEGIEQSLYIASKVERAYLNNRILKQPIEIIRMASF